MKGKLQDSSVRPWVPSLSYWSGASSRRGGKSLDAEVGAVGFENKMSYRDEVVGLFGAILFALLVIAVLVLMS